MALEAVHHVLELLARLLGQLEELRAGHAEVRIGVVGVERDGSLEMGFGLGRVPPLQRRPPVGHLIRNPHARDHRREQESQRSQRPRHAAILQARVYWGFLTV